MIEIVAITHEEIDRFLVIMGEVINEASMEEREEARILRNKVIDLLNGHTNKISVMVIVMELATFIRDAHDSGKMKQRASRGAN